MRRELLNLIIGISVLPAVGNAEEPSMDNAEVPKGYFFGDDAAPGGWEWQSPDSVAYNKELPRATFIPFGDAKSARKSAAGKQYISYKPRREMEIQLG